MLRLDDHKKSWLKKKKEMNASQIVYIYMICIEKDRKKKPLNFIMEIHWNIEKLQEVEVHSSHKKKVKKTKNKAK